jgi:hypothetical protein
LSGQKAKMDQIAMMQNSQPNGQMGAMSNSVNNSLLNSMNSNSQPLENAVS